MARVLFVDDEQDTLDMLRKAVELFGHEAILVSSGHDALRVAVDQKPDIVMVDMNLTDLNGLVIVEQLRADERTTSIPVVMLSAGPEMDAAERARAAGAQDYLLKPVRLQTLLDTIGKYAAVKPRNPG